MGKGDPRRRKGGRPRKEGPRFPCGKLRPQATLEQVERATWATSPLQPVLQTLRRHHDGVHSPEPVSKEDARRLMQRTTILGQLRADGHITQEQEEAGRAYAELLHRHAAIIGLPRGAPVSVSYGVVRGGASPPTEETIRAVREAYRAATRALTRHGVAVKYVTDDAVTRTEGRPKSLRLLTVGLDALAKK